MYTDFAWSQLTPYILFKSGENKMNQETKKSINTPQQWACKSDDSI